MNNVIIHSFASYLPSKRVTSAEIEELILSNSPNLKISPGTIQQVTGITSRPFSATAELASDLSVQAARQSLQNFDTKNNPIDMLIFASASHDLIEPATANIVQQKLGLNCPVLDVKNACNSFMNGLEVASALVSSKQYSNILVVTGETPSKVVSYTMKSRQQFKEVFASFTLGDGAGSAIVSSSDGESNILYKKFYTKGEYWQLATYYGSDKNVDSENQHFRGNAVELQQAFITFGTQPFIDALKVSNLTYSDISGVFMHQVASRMTDEAIKMNVIPKEKVIRFVEEHGNLASASIPVALHKSLNDKRIKSGDIVMIVGLASGISLSIWILRI